MLQEYNRYKILQEFFDFPRKDFHIRELSRRTEIAMPSIINHLQVLLRTKLIIREEKGIYPTFKANRDNKLFKVYKKSNLITRLFESGFVDYLYDSCLPNSIIIFGSASKGEDIEESDIDLFIQTKEKKLNISKYEKLLNRKISLFFEEKFSRLSKELKNNLINGIVLKGYLKVF